MTARAEFIAHRGAHDVFTENTLDAFQRAVELGFDAVELDVHATSDGVCVVHHDESVVTDRVALSIRGTYFDTLRAAAPLVPRLEEVLEILAGRVRLYVEMKSRDIDEYVADVLTAARADVAVHSFDHVAVRRFAERAPGIPTGILETGRLVDPVHALHEARARDLWQWHEMIDATLVRDVTAAGGRVIAWTANTPSEWRVFHESGVSGICTDLPPTPS